MEPFETYSDDPIYNIRAVTELTQIDPATLRAWERRYEIPMPKRDIQGHRLYSERDIMILRWLRSQVDASVRIKQAVDLLHLHAPQRLHETIAPPIVRASISREESQFEVLVNAFLDMVREFDYAGAQQIITQGLGLYPVEDVCLNLMLPALERMGDLWEDGTLTLQKEHFASNIIRERLQAMMASAPLPVRPGRLLIGCAPNDWHEFGAMSLTLLMRRRGWEVIYLGQNIGLPGLSATITELEPQALTLSVSRLPGVRQLIESARVFHQTTEGHGIFTYGGRIFNRLPYLSRYMPGVYLGMNILDAVHQLEDLLQQPPRSMTWIEPGGSDQNRAVIQAFKKERPFIEGAATTALLQLTSNMDYLHSAMAVHEMMEVLLLALQYPDPYIEDEITVWAQVSLPTYGVEEEMIPAFVSSLQEIMARMLPTIDANLINIFVQALASEA